MDSTVAMVRAVRASAAQCTRRITTYHVLNFVFLHPRRTSALEVLRAQFDALQFIHRCSFELNGASTELIYSTALVYFRSHTTLTETNFL